MNNQTVQTASVLIEGLKRLEANFDENTQTISKTDSGQHPLQAGQNVTSNSYHGYGYFRHSITVSVILTIAYSIVFIVGIIGNSVVVAIVCKSPRMRTVTNYFIANLALADILVLLFCLPATLVSNLFVRK